jgi:hypothetical protein
MTTAFDSLVIGMLRDARIYRQNCRNATILPEDALASWVNRIYVVALAQMGGSDPFVIELAAMNDWLQKRRDDERDASHLDTVRHEAARAEAALNIATKSIGVIGEHINSLPMARKLDSAQRFAEAIYQALRTIGNGVTQDDVMQDEEDEEENNERL